MNISRKDFFRQSLFSLGETIGALSGVAREPRAVESADREETAFRPTPRDDLVAVAHNQRCLAKNCGCFACMDRCEPVAIAVVMGEGIRIDASCCSGCGACEYVCPVTPKAVRLQPRGNEWIPSADMQTPERKENEPC